MLSQDQESAQKTLSHANKWRRGANIPMPDPAELGKAIDEAIRLFRVSRNEKHHDYVPMTGIRDEVSALEQLKNCVEILNSAADDIESWGCYASEYFQEKHDLEGSINFYLESAYRLKAYIRLIERREAYRSKHND